MSPVLTLAKQAASQYSMLVLFWQFLKSESECFCALC